MKAKKLFLYVGKTKLIIFRLRWREINENIKLTLDGKILTPTDSVKYFGVLLDDRLTWTKQINQVKTRLNQAIGRPSKLQYVANLNIFRITYYLIFGLYLLYGCQLYDKQKLDTSTLYRFF